MRKKIRVQLLIIMCMIFTLLGCTGNNDESRFIPLDNDLSDYLQEIETDSLEDETQTVLDGEESTKVKEQTSKAQEKSTSKNEVKSYKLSDLNSLKNTNNLRKSTIKHIFEGELNSRGSAVGYHYDNIDGTEGKVISGTESKPNKYGVYKAKVIVGDVKKSGNSGYSTFYPKTMSPQEVIDAINEAYNSKKFVTGNTYVGKCSKGFSIEMYLDDNNKIISAFPQY